MARCGYGEGSIYQRKDGIWVASITLEGRKRKTFYGKTRREVQENLKTALHEQQQGALATGPQQTVKLYLEQWLEEVHRPTIRLSSYDRYRYEMFQQLLQDAGLPHRRFHDLRHGASIILMAMGIRVKIVQELLGHSNAALTLNVYGNALPSLQKEAMEKWNILYRRQDKPDDQNNSEDAGSEKNG